MMHLILNRPFSTQTYVVGSQKSPSKTVYRALNINVETGSLENIHKGMLKYFAYLDLYTVERMRRGLS